MKRERTDTTPRGGRILTHPRPSALHLVAVMCVLVTGIALALGAMLSAAQAAPLGGLKQFRVPTAGADPRHITPGSDGNLWFTVGDIQAPFLATPNIGRITPAGTITEFPVNCQCNLNDIVQGPSNVLYFTSNNSGLGRITTSGQVLDPVPVPNNTTALGGGIAAHGDDVWFTDFNNNNIWRYNIPSGQFTQFPVPTPAATPFDVAVAANGIVWFTEFHANQIGRLDPATGVITETQVQGDPRQIAIASDGNVWFTERFSNAIGRLNPTTNQVTEFPTLTANAGPEDIAAAPNGALWFTQAGIGGGNIARISPDGTITEGRRVKNSGPYGITVAPNGDPWYAMTDANKIATLQLR